LIAATAIPVTVAATLGVLNAVGFNYIKSRSRALIVSLGILVDDAIVIADNYVELLDHDVPPPEAAWKSATEMAVPVLTATLTIIASFLPLVTLSGGARRIHHRAAAYCSHRPSLLLRRSDAANASARPVLHQEGLAQRGWQEEVQHPRFHAGAYNGAITFLMRRKIIAIGLGIAGVIAGVALFTTVDQQFFPLAERNQFVIDVWSPRRRAWKRPTA